MIYKNVISMVLYTKLPEPYLPPYLLFSFTIISVSTPPIISYSMLPTGNEFSVSAILLISYCPAIFLYNTYMRMIILCLPHPLANLTQHDTELNTQLHQHTISTIKPIRLRSSTSIPLEVCFRKWDKHKVANAKGLSKFWGYLNNLKWTNRLTI